MEIQFPTDIRNWRVNTRYRYPHAITITEDRETYNLPIDGRTTILPTDFSTISRQIRIRDRERDYPDNRRGWIPHTLLLEDNTSLSELQPNPNPFLATRQRFEYEILKKNARLIGSVPFEFRKDILFIESDRIDKTHNVPRQTDSLLHKSPVPTYGQSIGLKRLSTERIRKLTKDQFLEEGEYFLRKKQYNEYYIPLTPTFPYRAIKQVYFSHEIRYIPKDKFCPPSRITPPIQDLFHINGVVHTGYFQRGKRQNTSPGQPQSILLTRTPTGDTELEWYSRFEEINRTRYERAGYRIRSTLYFKLLEHQDNFQGFIDYFDTTKKFIRSPIEALQEKETKYRYHINNIYRNDVINQTIIVRVTNRLAANKILNTWRSWTKKKRGSLYYY
jgi:hypothetical protein